MSCRHILCSPDSTNIRRAAIELLQRQHFTRIYSILRTDTTTTIEDDQLDALSISRGPPLDVDNLAGSGQSDLSSRFFSPCDWSRASLEWESWSKDVRWQNLEQMDIDLVDHLDFARWRSAWFQVRLLNLETIEENVWKPVTEANRTRWDPTYEHIAQRIGLELPRRQYPKVDWSDHQYMGTWVYFVTPPVDKPHSVCVIIDSASPTDDLFLRSEVEAAVKMTEYQLQRPGYTHHCTKPILVCAFFRNQTARATQVHFDSINYKLVLRQSRFLDLTGLEPGPDAWTLLRWMASGPVGLTEYQTPNNLSTLHMEDGASRPPQLTLSDN